MGETLSPPGVAEERGKEMKMQFEAGEGRKFEGVNFLLGENDDLRIYGEIEIPEGCSDDFGYITLKNAIVKALEEKGIDTEIEWQYDGQEQFLEPDANAEGRVFVEIEEA